MYPLVSIIMPVYNAESFLNEAIISILNQQFDNFELILIDDGSTDSSLEIIKSFNDSRIRIIQNHINLGLIKSLNIGIKNSTGKYIARMDSDDISHSCRLKRQVEYLEKHIDVGVLGTAFNLLDDNKIENTIHHVKEVGILDLLECCQIGHPTVMIRKKNLEDNNFYYDENFDACEDYELWSRMINITKIHNLDEALVDYRIHNNQISNKKKSIQIKNSIQVKRKIIDKLTSDQKIKDYLEKYFLIKENVINLCVLKFIHFKILLKERKIHKIYCFNIPIVRITKKCIFIFSIIPIFFL